MQLRVRSLAYPRDSGRAISPAIGPADASVPQTVRHPAVMMKYSLCWQHRPGCSRSTRENRGQFLIRRAPLWPRRCALCAFRMGAHSPIPKSNKPILLARRPREIAEVPSYQYYRVPTDSLCVNYSGLKRIFKYWKKKRGKQRCVAAHQSRDDPIVYAPRCCWRTGYTV